MMIGEILVEYQQRDKEAHIKSTIATYKDDGQFFAGGSLSSDYGYKRGSRFPDLAQLAGPLIDALDAAFAASKPASVDVIDDLWDSSDRVSRAAKRPHRVGTGGHQVVWFREFKFDRVDIDALWDCADAVGEPLQQTIRGFGRKLSAGKG